MWSVGRREGECVCVEGSDNEGGGREVLGASAVNHRLGSRNQSIDLADAPVSAGVGGGCWHRRGYATPTGHHITHSCLTGHREQRHLLNVFWLVLVFRCTVVTVEL